MEFVATTPIKVASGALSELATRDAHELNGAVKERIDQVSTSLLDF